MGATATTRVLSNPSQNPAYRLTLAQRILTLCSQGTYENVTDFEWYLSVLVDLAYIANVDVGAQIREQLVDVTARVRAARRYAVQLMVKLLCDDSLLANAGDEGSCSEVLWAAAWICGEYCRYGYPRRYGPHALTSFSILVSLLNHTSFSRTFCNPRSSVYSPT